MLISFVFENYLSFKKTTTLSLEAASIRELSENTFPVTNTSVPFRTLKSAAIYGANASGKSSILKAFTFVRNFLLFPSGNDLQPTILEPYKLDPDNELKPILFEVTIFIDNCKYRYGFALTKRKLIISEWLYITEKRKEELLYKRDDQTIQIEKGFKMEAEGSVQMLAKITRENVLFISHLGQFKSSTAQKVLSWFEKTIVISDSNNQSILNYTASLLNIPYYKKRIIDIISKSDLSFYSIEAVIKEKAQKAGYDEGFIAALYDLDLNNYSIKTQHTKYKHQKIAGYTSFDLVENESLGSQKFVLLLGPLLRILKNGGVVLIDELDARLHTNLLLFVLRFFNSPLNNPLGSQLIYTSHNNIILQKDLRRDQMIFVKRDPYDGSIVTTLYNWDSKIRSDASFDKDYLKGKYGAVPKIDLSLDLFDQ